MMKQSLFSMAIAVAFASTGLSAMAQSHPVAGTFLGKVRASHQSYQDSNSLNADLKLESKLNAEFAGTYFIQRNFALEGSLNLPRRSTLQLNKGNVSSVKPWMLNFTGQYHFGDVGGIRPYVGAGLQMVHFGGSETIAPGGPTIDSGSKSGLVLQVGADFPINNNMVFNVDLKKSFVKADLVGGGTIKLDPVMVGAGFGMKF